MIQYQKIDQGTSYRAGFSVSPDGNNFCGSYYLGENLDHDGDIRGLTFKQYALFTGWGFETWMGPNASGTSARAINDQGDIAGFLCEPSKDPQSTIGRITPYIWQHGAADPTRFELVRALFETDMKQTFIPNSIYAINNDGYVAGAYTEASGTYGFVADPRRGNFIFHLVSCEKIAGPSTCWVGGLNAARHIVGTFHAGRRNANWVR